MYARSALRAPFVALALLAAASLGCAAGKQTDGDAGSTSGGSGGGNGGITTLSLPQFVHGAARVDTAAYVTIPIVVAFSGTKPDVVEVTVGGKVTKAVADGGRFIANVPASSITGGAHPIDVVAKRGGVSTGHESATLVVDTGSLKFTEYAADGPAYATHLVHDGDALALTWVDVRSGLHQLYMSRLDGAFRRIDANDVVLNDPADEPLDGYTAFGNGSIGVVYRTAKTNDVHWSVKMRIVDRAGVEQVPVMDLTQGESAFARAQAGVDPGGFSGAWVHITPPIDPLNPPPLEVRFSRWDVGANALVGPITLDMDQPAPPGSTEGPQSIEPLAELGIACNSSICLVTYTRDVYIPLVALNVPKLFVAVVDLASGQLAAPPTAVEKTDWDTQLFGHHVIALADGSFALVYTANDTDAAINPKSPCDQTLERDLLFAVRFDATGQQLGKPAPIFDFQGTREYPRIAEHPAGFALFWEDQRSECQANGHIRMAFDVTDANLGKLLDGYKELPGSVGLPPEDPTLAVTGTNFVVGWSDDRDGGGLLNPKPELFFDTNWRK